MSQLQFREQVIFQAFKEFYINFSLNNSSNNSNNLNVSYHDIGVREQRNCVVCSKTNDRKTTIYYCTICLKNVHPNTCFKIMHTED